MNAKSMKLVVLGLSLSSSWGNGHATTYRALLNAFAARGHEVLFLEQDAPWYAAHRDLGAPGFCRLAFYQDLDDLERFADEVRAADAVIVGSYVPDGIAVGDWAMDMASGPVAFYDIDTPVTLARLKRGDCAYLSAGQIGRYDLYLSFTGGPTLEQLEQHYGSPMARPLYCSADADVHRPLDEPVRWDLSYLGTYSDDRQPGLEKLMLESARRAPELRFCVAGPQYPDDIDWPDNVERIDHVPPAEHPAFYARSRFTLNLTRSDMKAAGHSPSVRLFEAGACGCPVISDVWDGLEALFTPGEEIILARSADEVLATLAGTPAQVRSLGQAARDRVMRAHTSDRRAAELEAALCEAVRQNRSRAHPRDDTSMKPAMASRMSAALRRQKGLKVLVTGAAGFLGSHLCDRLLAQGATVTGLDNLQTGSLDNLTAALRNPKFELVRADIVNPLPKRVWERSFDRIYNLACAASPPLYQADPEHTLLTSVIGTRHLLQLAEKCGARFLLTSTSEVYGDPDVHPQPETYWGNVNSTGPRACYDEGKRCAETLTFDYDRAGRGEVRVARIFNTYGPRLSAADGRVVSNLVGQALSGDDITVFGDGRQTRSFCYVDDLIDGLIALMEHDGVQPGPVNLGNPAERTINDLVREVLRLTGSSSRVVRCPLPVDDPRRRRPDIGRAEAVLGWRPAIPLEQGLRATIDWFDQASATRVASDVSTAVIA